MTKSKKETQRAADLARLHKLLKKHEMNANDLAKLVDGKWQTARTWISGISPVPRYVFVIFRMKEDLDTRAA